jgi:hypothetical protein
MPRLDECHDQVVHALEKAGWSVDPNPFTVIVSKGHVLHIDIEAQRRTPSGRQTIIIVEVKCFPASKAETDELYTAIGQYVVYRSLLRRRGLADRLYLAIPTSAFQGIFQRMGMEAIQENRVKMIVVDVEREEIEQWLE